jgi:hypothetical protein
MSRTTKKPICTFCLNLGKTETEYSHYTYSLPDRNGKSNTLCPELLATECKYCFKLGHTVKYCPKLKQDEKDRERSKKVVVAKKTKPTTAPVKKPASVFNALMDSDSEDEESPNNQVSKQAENYPLLCAPTIKKVAVEKQEVKTGWAAIVAKPAEVKLVEPAKRTGLIMLSDYIKIEPKVEVTSKPAPWAKKQPVVTKSWADWSDSEEEDELDKSYSYVAAPEEEDETW